MYSQYVYNASWAKACSLGICFAFLLGRDFLGESEALACFGS